MKYIEYYRKNKGEENGVSYNAFMMRIKSWWTWEDAITIRQKEAKYNKYQPPKKDIKNPTRYIIDIKYSSEAALVIASVYESMLKEIEDKYYMTDEPQEAMALIEEKKRLKKEYEIFLNAQI